MLDNPSRVPSATPISGRRVAHLKRTAVYRAFLAADLVRGQVVLRKPTIGQVAQLLKVSPTYIQAALKSDIYKRLSVVHGCEPLIQSEPKAKPASPFAGSSRWSESLAEHLARSTAAERAAAAREVGADVVWDDMIMPTVS
jgi:hypothetical protein